VFILASRSATVLVIFIIAIIAFCLATVFASMTGPISILPAKNESGGVLDNLSVITDTKDGGYSGQSYGYKDKDYTNKQPSSQSSKSNVETTTDTSSSKDTSQSSNPSKNPSSGKSSDKSSKSTGGS
jgi:hypothetical protein